MLNVALLGTGGMMPLPDRFLTALMCRLNGRLLLIDCGEGTQVAIKNIGWGFKKIDVICLTHFHADHIAGLPGLLLTIGSSGREEEMTIVGPVGVEEVVNKLRVIAPDLPYKIKFIELDKSTTKFINIKDFYIEACEVKHKVKCFAYGISVLRKGQFILEKAKGLDLPVKYWGQLQKGKDVIYKNNLYTSNMVMSEDRKGIKVNYCTDARPSEELNNFVKNADLFICEGLYGDDGKKEKAINYMHMVFSEACNIAKTGDVKELWLTHFSPSLLKPDEYLDDVIKIFENTKVGEDGMTKTVFFE